MERMTDKCAVFIVCLVCLLTGDALAGEAGGAALLSAPGVAMVLLAISAAALEHALPARLRAVAPIAYGVVALAAQPGLYFMPLALYDAMREIHEPGVVRDAPGIVAGLLAVSVVAWHPQFSSILLVLASCGLAALLALRTNRLLARLGTFNRIRDDLALRTRSLQDRNRALEAELHHVQHAGGAPGTAGFSTADGTPADGTPATAGTPACSAGLSSMDAPTEADLHSAAFERPAAFRCLTDREYEVARLVADGLDNREIAAAAYMGEGTVRNHISSILSKMQLSNRTQLAVSFWRAHYEA
ncbi:helix-turn-helix transcriptional regulator [Enorma massiliensis]|uniref:helix-turn-helix transcriptional regulator n=1 Tax=Enorma massiliensis TaxID=1472761 RepID=UPI0023F1DF97|nr:LuxR C-terminal-related transcriptional regulator [Enorma massiliensis]